MTMFYFVRHGKTEYNVKGIFQGGRTDSPLLQEGREGAIKVGEYLSSINFDAAFASPQGRAQDTANLILAENNNSISKISDWRLKELDFGEWDGKPASQFQNEEQYLNLKKHPDIYDPSAFYGETYQQVLKRVKNFFDEKTKEFPEGRILVVAHAIVISTLLNDLADQPIALIRKNGLVANTSLSIVEKKQNEIKIITINDTSFLE